MADQPAAAPMTAEQAEAARAELAAFDAAQAAAAAADRAAKLKALTDLLGSDTWTALRAALPAAVAASIGEPFYDQVRAVDMITGNLAHQVSITMPAPVNTSVAA